MTNKLYTKKTTIAEWYGNSITVPSISSPKFRPFATSCLGIASLLLEKKISRTIRVGLSYQIDTAYADPSKSLVVISERFLKGDFSGIDYDKSLSAPKTIGAILGVIVHEIAHFAYSPKDLAQACEYIRVNTKRVYSQAMAKRIANTIEDIYIENRISKSAPTLAWSLDEINRLMLTEDKYRDAIKFLAKLESVSNSSDTNNILNFLLFAKVTSDSGKTSNFVKSIFKLARSVIRMDETLDRYKLALKLYDLLVVNESDQPESDTKLDSDSSSNQSESDETDNDQSDDGQSDDGQSDDSEDTQDDSEDDNQESDDQDDDQESNDQSDSSDNEEEEEEDQESDDQESDDPEYNNPDESESTDESAPTIYAESTPDELPEIKIVDAYSSDESEPSVIEIVESDTAIAIPSLDGHKVRFSIMPSDTEQLEMDKRYTKLAQVALQRASAKLAYSSNQNRGRDLRQLHRIVTDRKVFANKLDTDTMLPMEIIIVLDCSGSMASYGSTKLIQASMATLGAATGLLSGRCQVSVYGHSADVQENRQIEIYGLMQNGESPTTLAKRLSRLNRYKYLYCAANRDGYAFYEIAKKFSKSGKRKVMLVISDGQPSGNTGDYQNFYALNHTRKMVESIRAKGISVFSLSIDREAFAPNNQIYGAKNNVCNLDPNAIDDMIREFFLK